MGRRACRPGTAVRVQTSAHGRAVRAVFEAGTIRWSEPQRRVAPGQSVVLYDTGDDKVLGGGVAR